MKINHIANTVPSEMTTKWIKVQQSSMEVDHCVCGSRWLSPVQLRYFTAQECKIIEKNAEMVEKRD